MKIYAPVKDFTGLRANVRFVNGVGETDNPQAIEWFRSHGYKVPVEERVEKVVVESTSEVNESKIDETIDTSEPDFDAMTPNELREWMKANGMGMQIKNIRSKEKLLEMIRG